MLSKFALKNLMTYLRRKVGGGGQNPFKKEMTPLTMMKDISFKKNYHIHLNSSHDNLQLSSFNRHSLVHSNIASYVGYDNLTV